MAPFNTSLTHATSLPASSNLTTLSSHLTTFMASNASNSSNHRLNVYGVEHARHSSRPHDPLHVPSGDHRPRPPPYCARRGLKKNTPPRLRPCDIQHPITLLPTVTHPPAF